MKISKFRIIFVLLCFFAAAGIFILCKPFLNINEGVAQQTEENTESSEETQEVILSDSDSLNIGDTYHMVFFLDDEQYAEGNMWVTKDQLIEVFDDGSTDEGMDYLFLSDYVMGLKTKDGGYAISLYEKEKDGWHIKTIGRTISSLKDTYYVTYLDSGTMSTMEFKDDGTVTELSSDGNVNEIIYCIGTDVQEGYIPFIKIQENEMTKYVLEYTSQDSFTLSPQ